jgi:hypothetical protein
MGSNHGLEGPWLCCLPLPLIGCDRYMGNSTNCSCEFFVVTRSHMYVSVESIITYRMAAETLHLDFAKTFDFLYADLQ